MNETPSAAPCPAISEEERVRRQRAVDFARGSVAYEGGSLTDETEHISARYVAGEIDGDEMTAAILKLYAPRP
jgi:hypothetical protein